MKYIRIAVKIVALIFLLLVVFLLSAVIYYLTKDNSQNTNFGIASIACFLTAFCLTVWVNRFLIRWCLSILPLRAYPVIRSRSRVNVAASVGYKAIRLYIDSLALARMEMKWFHLYAETLTEEVIAESPWRQSEKDFVEQQKEQALNRSIAVKKKLDTLVKLLKNIQVIPSSYSYVHELRAIELSYNPEEMLFRKVADYLKSISG